MIKNLIFASFVFIVGATFGGLITNFIWISRIRKLEKEEILRWKK